MYGFNKPRGRLSLSPKEKFLLGPQFTLQASATAVQERPPVKKEVNYKNVDPLQAHGGNGSSVVSSTTQLRRPASFGDTTTISTTDAANSAAGYFYRQNSTGSTSRRQHSGTSSTSARRDAAKAFLQTSAFENPEGQSGHSLSSYSNHLNTYLPGDKVMFRDSHSSAGTPVVYRSPEEKAVNSERLNLDRRGLVVCPILDGEDQLRLLNYQHNAIRRIENIDALRRLIFLDFYDNQIECIDGLSALRSLRVLMLGKNRIKRIEHLDTLTKLDVLDLHGNQIKQIEGLQHLADLRVLNLAGNAIEVVKNLAGLDSLVELNLRRNRITNVTEIEGLPNLQRLFLSFNNISSFEDMSCVGESTSLSELALDGNPFEQDQLYKQTILKCVQQIRILDMKRVTDDERRIATVMSRKEEEKRRENSKMAAMTEKRKRAINTVRRHWETMQNTSSTDDQRVRHAGKSVADSEGGAGNYDTSQSSNKELHSNGAQDRSDSGRPVSAKNSHKDKGLSAGSNARPNSVGPSMVATETSTKQSFGKDGSSAGHEIAEFLSEIDGDTLQLYGTGSLDAFDRNWGIQAAGAVTAVSFHFLDFNDIVKVLPKIRIRFPNVSSLSFSATNIRTLTQLNALATVRRLDSLAIESDGNPVTRLLLWRPYVIFRLAHFTLKRINGVEVSVADIVNAEKFFGPLANIISSKVPQSRLAALLGDKKKQLLSDDRTKRNQNDTLKLFTSGGEKTETVGRAVLTYSCPPSTSSRTTAEELSSRGYMVRSLCNGLVDDALLIHQHRSVLASEWSGILTEFVRKAVVEIWDQNAFMKRCYAAELAAAATSTTGLSSSSSTVDRNRTLQKESTVDTASAADASGRDS